MFYNNNFYWGNNVFYKPYMAFWKPSKTYIWQTNRTFGGTDWFRPSITRIVDIGIVTKGRNCNLE